MPKPRVCSCRNDWKTAWPIIIFIILSGAGALIGHFATKFDRFFLEGDPALAFPLVDQTVPYLYDAIAVGPGMALLMAISAPIIRCFPTKNPRWDEETRYTPLQGVIVPWLGLGAAFTTNLLITEVTKTLVARKRPNYFALCNYNGYREWLDRRITGEASPDVFDGWVPGRPGNQSLCRDTEQTVEASSSFPSGHSSNSYTGLLFASYYMAALWRARRPKLGSDHRVGMVGMYIILLAFCGAGWVAITRSRDYFHNYDDIATGSIIGVFSATAVFIAVFRRNTPFAFMFGESGDSQVRSSKAKKGKQPKSKPKKAKKAELEELSEFSSSSDRGQTTTPTSDSE